ncbi:40S ribosomal protein S9, variant [Blastomyces dermatitidis ER-3]|uniref:Small ribosomal subunit protein uS9m n=2 Tax=Ajellomyces dermatitidis TaxID=5039 RepID=F2TK70_AJEDA|nr:40S ribosomal protein S9 [Blastomyces dermatitidis ER-3]XP_045281194.1 40S ribosomal protein S9, variant [Blastomyces dermatitidis ER-3]EEQ90140.1 40S ribosomal protein S9 [Blastomyces dermatitidis ER-3]EGE83633.1 40S ribosomal protein S9 [Blastomyces dermatitidis ATCC 18188]OAT01467.1 40S ribosomal protein S9, variant [Blastomyces dermatitidis ER-3]
MAWQGPSCIARALRSAQHSFRSECHLSHQPYLSTATTYLRSQRRSLSTSPEQQLDITAAPPIDTTKLKCTPQRILPASPAYFTGTPKFIDHVLKLEQIHSKYFLLPTVPPGEAPRTAFLKHADYKNAINEEVPAAKYRQLQKVLARLNQIRPDKVPQEVKDMLKSFTRPGDPYQQKLAPKTLDEMGRARGVGRRKTSHARVWLVEGDGEVLINGKNIVQVFPRVHDRESALWPLRATNRLDKYNVFAITRGGGVTGQAEAITVALGKALLVHEPAMKPILRKAGCISTDPRQVERKKHGHLKARKMPAWVRR